MNKFLIAGVSKYKGVVKVRFATDMTRVKLLAKNGHEDINLLDLPGEMEKPEIVKFLKTTDLYQNAEFRASIDEADEKYNGATAVKSANATTVKTGGVKTVKTVKTVTANATAKVTASLDELKARAAAQTAK